MHRLSFEQEKELIDYFRINPSLWNTKDKDYNNRTLRQDKLDHIADQLRLTRKDVYEKYRNLRTTFFREHKRVTSSSSTNTNNSTDDQGVDDNGNSTSNGNTHSHQQPYVSQYVDTIRAVHNVGHQQHQVDQQRQQQQQEVIIINAQDAINGAKSTLHLPLSNVGIIGTSAIAQRIPFGVGGGSSVAVPVTAVKTPGTPTFVLTTLANAVPTLHSHHINTSVGSHRIRQSSLSASFIFTNGGDGDNHNTSIGNNVTNSLNLSSSTTTNSSSNSSGIYSLTSTKSNIICNNDELHNVIRKIVSETIIQYEDEDMAFCRSLASSLRRLEQSKKDEKLAKANVITKCLETTPLPTNITRESVEQHREQIAACALRSEGWFTQQGGYDFSKAEKEIKNKRLQEDLENQVLNYHSQCRVESEDKYPTSTNSSIIAQIQLYQACMDYFISDVCGIEVNDSDVPQF
ncbi:hypothetical protein DERP_003972 [Dermatophagoides pteronyssinus]|uniref:MADF domain-containing protein n=1 Tax=Dermatophagoides pteronyssinus TaxID=6956 RepID=A0ABQ8J8G4_DERPT|nr:hypothetical protein DERP_003972 [Dermatophagoides pteronyssinus]